MTRIPAVVGWWRCDGEHEEDGRALRRRGARARGTGRREGELLASELNWEGGGM